MCYGVMNMLLIHIQQVSQFTSLGCSSFRTCMLSSLPSINEPSSPNHQLIPQSYSVLIFIITILLLAADFYYLKNIAGRRLVGLRWWNEVDPSSGDSHWVFESSDPNTKVINPTDNRFFWIALYSQPLLWVGLAFVAIFRFEFIWLTLIGKPFLYPFSVQGRGDGVGI